MWTADIDVGGTLTDGVFSNGENLVCVKAVTTPHDLTLCLFDCLAQGASKLGFADTEALLEHLELIRWSTTITSNVLAELRGPRVGLLVCSGHEKDLYGSQARSSVIGRIVAESDVIGLSETAGETEIMTAARTLLERGVRRICVSLKGSHRHPSFEAIAKRVIERQYPDHFLGSVPVLAGSDISKSSDDQTRTCCALINAYTHGALAATLFKAEDEMRETFQYAGTFLVSHVNGGAAGISKTKAIDTIESGPMLGIHASAHMARAYDISELIAMDIGGTTAKISFLRGSAPVYRKPSDFFGTPLDIRLPDLHSIALGGGSVVKPPVSASGDIRLGPESMGSYPGPACYDLGGDQPTLTDAFVSAGLINPDYFLGGKRRLDLSLARRSIEESVARALNVSVEKACALIIERAFETVSDLMARAEGDPDSPRQTLFAYGGNGGLFACGVADKAKLDNVRVFWLAPVFSAFGSSVSDISHVYERRLSGLPISDDTFAEVRGILEEIKAESVRDLLGEGVSPEGVTHTIELEVSPNRGEGITMSCPEDSLRGAEEFEAFIRLPDGAPRAGGSFLELVRVRARKAISKPRLVERPPQGEASSHARTGTREVFWGSRNGTAEIYRWEMLQPGNRIAGCAVVEGENTTYLIPEGWQMTLDRFGNGEISRVRR